MEGIKGLIPKEHTQTHTQYIVSLKCTKNIYMSSTHR